MSEAVALVMPKVLNSKLRLWIDDRARAEGVKITWVDLAADASSYCSVVRSCANVIAWNCRIPWDWMRKNGSNVLYVENSLICQSAGIFVDMGGFFSKSRLCLDQTWNEGHRYALEWVSEKWFSWKHGFEGCPTGPVLLALQNRLDCNINTEFPMAGSEPDKVVAALRIVGDQLPPDVPLLVRPHPSERFSFNNGGVWRENWTLDEQGDFSTRLQQCRAMVTVNSTCASEAALSRVPVATLGTGAFTGSGAMWECHNDAARLNDFLGQPVNFEARNRYASAILARHFLPYDLAASRECREFDDWLKACR